VAALVPQPVQLVKPRAAVRCGDPRRAAVARLDLREAGRREVQPVVLRIRVRRFAAAADH
jgi:hypothetical protein